MEKIIEFIYLYFNYVKLSLLIYLVYQYPLMGIPLFISIKFVYDKFYKICYGLTSLRASDRMFLDLPIANKYNIVNVMRFKNSFDVKLFISSFNKRLQILPKLRSILIRKNFDYFWKELEYSEEFINKIIEIREVDFQTKKQIFDFMEEESNIYFDLLKEIPYKFIILKNKHNNEDLLVLKTDHIFSDGLGYVSLLFGMADNFDPSIFPFTFKFSLKETLKAYLLMPYYVIYCFYNQFVNMTKNNNPYLKNTPLTQLTGKSTKLMSRKYILSEFTTLSKEMNITFNDLMILIFSESFYKYYKNHIGLEENKIKGSLTALLTVGSRNIPSQIQDVELHNDSTGIPFSIPIMKDPYTSYHHIKKMIDDQVKNWPLVMNMKFITDFLCYFISKDLFLAFVRRTPNDFIFSNVPGPKKPVFFCNSELVDTYNSCTPGFNHTFLGVGSYNNTFRLSVYLDLCSKMNCAKLVETLEETLESFYFNKTKKTPTHYE